MDTKKINVLGYINYCVNFAEKVESVISRIDNKFPPVYALPDEIKQNKALAQIMKSILGTLRTYNKTVAHFSKVCGELYPKLVQLKEKDNHFIRFPEYLELFDSPSTLVGKDFFVELGKWASETAKLLTEKIDSYCDMAWTDGEESEYDNCLFSAFGEIDTLVAVQSLCQILASIYSSMVELGDYYDDLVYSAKMIFHKHLVKLAKNKDTREYAELLTESMFFQLVSPVTNSALLGNPIEMYFWENE